MINKHSMTDLINYRQIVVKTSAFILSILSISLFSAWHFETFFLVKPFAGALLGSFLASINVFALGYAFFIIAIKKSSRKAIFWPLATFLAMCTIAFYLALNEQGYLLGFALGLTTPLIFGTIIALRA